MTSFCKNKDIMRLVGVNQPYDRVEARVLSGKEYGEYITLLILRIMAFVLLSWHCLGMAEIECNT